MTPAKQERLFADWCELHPEWRVRVLETIDLTIPPAEVRNRFEALGGLLTFAADDFIFSEAERAEYFSNPRFWWIERTPTNRPSLVSDNSIWKTRFASPHHLLVDTLSLDVEVFDMKAILAGELEDVHNGSVTFRTSQDADLSEAEVLRDLVGVDGVRRLSESAVQQQVYESLRRYSVNTYVTSEHPFVKDAQREIANRRLAELRESANKLGHWTTPALITSIVAMSNDGHWFAQPTGHDDVFGCATTVDTLNILLPIGRDDLVAEIAHLARQGEVLRTITGHVLPADWTFAEHVKRECGVPNLLTLFKPESRNTFLALNPSYAQTLEVPDTADTLIEQWFSSTLATDRDDNGPDFGLGR